MDTEVIKSYLNEVISQFSSGHAREHSYRPAMERLMKSFDKVHAVNEPKRSAHGAPDFVFLSDNNNDLILGYAEAKDIGADLNRVEKTNQMDRYRGYANLILTDYLEFRFFKNGEKYKTISLGTIQDNTLQPTPENGEQLLRELAAFLELPPEKIKSGKRLAQIMGGKALRIRDNVEDILSNPEDVRNKELVRIYEMMKTLLVHDLTEEKFADMYSQTLVYGLFVARYGDSTPETFTRSEARDLVPKSNPFLHHFFDHIVGPNFVTRLGYIVDELCEVFSVSDVRAIVHKHLKIADDTNDAKDPIIHFYEDFLQEYDPAERKKMGAYYTPTPVVKYIVRQVDRILKEEFGIAKGLASSETIQYEVEVGQDMRTDKRMKANTKQKLTVPRVQILDPAVGTATFLNETIKFIHKEFEGQEGRWPSYVNDNLLKRLHGFELMMAPYTIAHLKLGMTLRETGVDNLSDRLGVYLTNTLEEGVPQQPDLFSFGLAEAVSEESRLAAEVKSERPVMVVMGNPPYSGESSNKTKFADSLIDKYRVEPGGKQKLQEQNYKWLGDDYVKFISFAEDMIKKNGEGIVAMITNNGYLDNPTFRGMRWHLAKTFDKIYVLDLHGNTKKKEVAQDGSKDVNVFDIQQGVGIIIAIKNKGDSTEKLAEIYHQDIYGERQYKFDALGKQLRNESFRRVNLDESTCLFVPRSTVGLENYSHGINVKDLFNIYSTGILTKNDKVAITFDKKSIWGNITNFNALSEEALRSMYGLKKDSRDWALSRAIEDVKISHSEDNIIDVTYRPFDTRYSYYTGRPKGFMAYSQMRVMQHLFKRDNLAIISGRQGQAVGSMEWNLIHISDNITDLNIFYRGGGTAYPLYIYHEDGTRTPNFDPGELSALTTKLTADYEPEDILDYIYAALHSPGYRDKYKEFLKSDFPHVPIPTQGEFDRLVPLGTELRQLHLMKSPVIDDYKTTYPELGGNLVEKVRYEDSKVYINETQYFGNVPETAWDFYIGGYQPAQKWLKDRKGRKLDDKDLDHYQKIIKILIETDKIMKEIG